MNVAAEEIRDLLEKYLLEYPDEVARLARLSEALTSADTTIGHVTAAAVLIDPQWRVLHEYERDRQRYRLPEAHLTGADDSIADAALRELYERFGIEPDTIAPLPGFEVIPLDIDVHRRPADRTTGRRAHLHFEVRHAFQVAGTPILPDGSSVAWLAPEAVPGFTLRLKVRALQRAVVEDTGAN